VVMGRVAPVGCGEAAKLHKAGTGSMLKNRFVEIHSQLGVLSKFESAARLRGRR
jgi:hypothetical protein